MHRLPVRYCSGRSPQILKSNVVYMETTALARTRQPCFPKIRALANLSALVQVAVGICQCGNLSQAPTRGEEYDARDASRPYRETLREDAL